MEEREFCGLKSFFLSSTASEWDDVSGVNCRKTTETRCDFTAAGLLQGFPRHFNVSLRVQAELGDRVSAWATVPWFQHYRNVTIGPPENMEVAPGEGSLIIRFSAPFDIDTSMVTFEYYVYYWEEAGTRKVKGPVKSNFISLDDLKPLRVYCLQVQAELVWSTQGISLPGNLSNTSCHKTTLDAATKLEQAILTFVGASLSVVLLVGACFFMILRYRGLIKYWFHSPPKIPLQIGEYLKDPAQPILETLDKDSSPKEDAWDSVSIISFPEKEQDARQSTLNQSAGPAQLSPERGH
ncbi:interferon gamma receptor 2 [Trichechus manatus latirostris]|uniref:Interferon gamma receptor 2 n=1 Tax=Trichechus manatus latirostris TaxID=127582 RepID=A0A2Y9RZ99_TRIMA|nr:interferon gamma receptor 2 [Trichechus manatus latirostris]